MITKTLRAALLAGAALLGISAAPAAKAADGNILLVIADDFGQDAAWASSAWQNTTIPRAPQPNLQALANRGVTFGNFDAHMECSPTRAAVMTGQYAFRPQNGVGQYITDTRPDLPNGAFTLFDAFNRSPAGQLYRTAYVGKLHLYHGSDGPNAPLLQGGITNFNGPLPGGALPSYYHYQNTNNGMTFRSDTYATTVQADFALSEMFDFQDNLKPYFVVLSFNAAHTSRGGYERPPNDLHGYDTIPFGPVDDRVHFDAAVQAMDTELGRVLAAVDFTKTTVIFMGDNGTAGRVHRAPYGPRGCKSTIYQCGVAVPFVIAGKHVQGTVPRVDLRLAQDVDVFSTILQLAGISPSTTIPAGRKIDGKSLVPYMTSGNGNNGRIYNYNETFTGIWNQQPIRSIRGGAFKLVTRPGGRQELYRTIADPFENRNLIGTPLTPEATEARTRLLGEMNRLLATR